MEEAAAQRPFVVVLTGGPSSGKSSALALLKNRLSTRGFQVVTIPEMATHLLINSDGFQPEWAGTEAQVQVQRLFVDFQMAQEAAFTELAQLHPTKRPVLVLDSCTLNPKVYLTDEQWERALKFPGKPVLSEESLLGRYDLVIHLVTCAHGGHYEWGPGSNNPGRFHNREQAQTYDERALQVFGAHPQLRVVPHFADFDDKIAKVVEFVNDALHIEGLNGKRRRKRCKVNASADLAALVALPSTIGTFVTSTFLDEEMQHSVRRHAKISGKMWLEEFNCWRDPAISMERQPSSIESKLGLSRPLDGIEHATEVTYERRTKVLSLDNSLAKPCLTRKVITPEDYYLAIESCSSPAVSTKMVLRFLANSTYYELFFNPKSSDIVLDFPADASQDHPDWLEFINCQELAPEESVASIAQDPMDSQRASKRQRFLCAHTTEESAFMGS